MKIYSWNVNGIRAVLRKDNFYPFISQHDPDILCIQETKASPDQIELEDMGYEIHINSADKKGYSGTMILSKTKPIQVINNIPDKYIGALKADGYGDANREGRVIAAEFNDFWIVTCYTPNAKDKLLRIELRQDWDKAMTAYCADLQKKKPVIYCGDMNVAHTPDDLARPVENEGKKGYSAQERTGFDNWLNVGFTDTFRQFTKGNGHYTWWTAWGGARERNVGWRIDYFLVSKVLENKVKSAKIHADVMGSDHCPVSIELST
jgi:exodeoxyribonuclease III